ncbi:hypothetical protein [Streptomyces varsoviensis]|uniref:Uncharacterized protein n=1 Tax=Streptomyces varsoviensis TaxID=67373 RepID=A0ABR5JA36_9ACTN|nr:hypothetical protein [Streptomyces varsoviensis]KOG90270.1 hypothetical protein ADK38_09680 [Streptomyces varsoviensis]
MNVMLGAGLPEPLLSSGFGGPERNAERTGHECARHEVHSTWSQGAAWHRTSGAEDNGMTGRER